MLATFLEFPGIGKPEAMPVVASLACAYLL